MTDREMLELAARAAGIRVVWDEWSQGILLPTHDGIDVCTWNPRVNKADAFDLQVKLSLRVECSENRGEVQVVTTQRPFVSPVYVYYSQCNNDPATATMLAITRAAAEIGRAMNTTGEQK